MKMKKWNEKYSWPSLYCDHLVCVSTFVAPEHHHLEVKVGILIFDWNRVVWTFKFICEVTWVRRWFWVPHHISSSTCSPLNQAMILSCFSTEQISPKATLQSKSITWSKEPSFSVTGEEPTGSIVSSSTILTTMFISNGAVAFYGFNGTITAGLLNQNETNDKNKFSDGQFMVCLSKASRLWVVVALWCCHCVCSGRCFILYKTTRRLAVGPWLQMNSLIQSQFQEISKYSALAIWKKSLEIAYFCLKSYHLYNE